jgi:hypothetical protein
MLEGLPNDTRESRGAMSKSGMLPPKAASLRAAIRLTYASKTKFSNLDFSSIPLKFAAEASKSSSKVTVVLMSQMMHFLMFDSSVFSRHNPPIPRWTFGRR